MVLSARRLPRRIRDPFALDLNRDQAKHPLRQEWLFTPNTEFARLLPDCWKLELTEISLGGCRRLAPSPNLDSWLPHAWVGGLAMLQWRNQLSCEELQRHRLAWFLFQKAKRIQPFLKRNFRGPKDFRIYQQHRTGDADGFPIVSRGQILTLNNLLEIGRRQAKERGETRPCSELVVQFGLFQLARENPLQLNSQETVRLIRDALFDWSFEPNPVEEQVVHFVWDRLVVALEPHLDEHTR